nr:hypothetical protein [Eubacterium sp.]
MKIAFWSNSPGKAGVTGNLSCISILSALYQPSEMVLFENHSSISNLGSTFLNPNSYDVLQEKNSYFVENGLGRILSYCSGRDMINEKMMIHRTCLSVLDQRVFYLPTGGMNRELLEYRLNRYAGEVLSLLEKHCHTVCVDLSSVPFESSRRILQEVDLIVVNLCQNHQLLSHFFRNFSEIQKKAFYVIGNYDPESVITKSDIVGRYRLDRNRVGTIPYNRRFADALTKGKVVPFLLQHYNCDAKDINHEFMCASLETVSLLEQRKKEIERKGGRQNVEPTEGGANVQHHGYDIPMLEEYASERDRKVLCRF